MNKTIVYGVSDDLIEIEGDLRAEFYSHASMEKDYVAFSSGLILGVIYQGEWKVEAVKVPEHTDVTIHPAGSEDAKNTLERERDDYMDVAVIEGPKIEWAMKGKQITPRTMEAG